MHVLHIINKLEIGELIRVASPVYRLRKKCMKDNTISKMKEILEEIDEYLKKYLEETYDSFQIGATDEELSLLQKNVSKIIQSQKN